MLKRDLELALKGPVEEGVPLAGRTSVRVGGKAELFATVPNEDVLADALDACAQHGAPWHVLGGGTNVLVSDAGIHGVVFKLGPCLAPEETRRAAGDRISIRVGGGCSLGRLVGRVHELGAVGASFLGGIPGTVGGAVVGNAGTKEGTIEAICEEVGLVEVGRKRTVSAAEIGFGYRSTRLPSDAVVSWVRVSAPTGSPEAVAASRQAIASDLERRRRTQPYDHASFGCAFRNPPGDSAGRLIEACRLKGACFGGAGISTLHANFIVNLGGATAADVLALMRTIFNEVRARFGIALVPEVKLLGEFDRADLPWLDGKGVSAA